MRGWWRRSPVAAPSSGAMSGDLAAAVTVRSFLTVRDRFPVTGEVKQGLWGIFPACRECALWPYFRARVCYGYNYHRSVTTRENGMSTFYGSRFCRQCGRLFQLAAPGDRICASCEQQPAEPVTVAPAPRVTVKQQRASEKDRHR